MLQCHLKDPEVGSKITTMGSLSRLDSGYHARTTYGPKAHPRRLRAERAELIGAAGANISREWASSASICSRTCRGSRELWERRGWPVA